MAEGDELKGASISQLLFSDDAVMGLEISGAYRNYCSFSTENPPKMLYFGDYDDSGVTCSASSSASSTNTSIIKALSISNVSEALNSFFFPFFSDFFLLLDQLYFLPFFVNNAEENKLVGYRSSGKRSSDGQKEQKLSEYCKERPCKGQTKL